MMTDADPTQMDNSAHESYANVSIQSQDVVAGRRNLCRTFEIERCLISARCLLELAFQQGFHQFGRPSGGRFDARLEGLLYGKKVALHGPAMPSPRFAKGVERCIECDFAQGTDLNSEQLQASFYVVCGLGRCEQQARGL
jgi:hypothetical protein